MGWTRSLTAAAAVAALAAAAPAARADAPRVVEITAKRFAFDPAEIHLRRGEAATLRLTSRDVTHGLFVRPLGVDVTLSPGKTTEVTVTPKEAGRFTAICNHFCGVGHGNMHLAIVVENAPKEAAR